MSDLDDELEAARLEMMMDRSRRSLAVDDGESEEDEDSEGDIFDGISDNEYGSDDEDEYDEDYE
eukprot:SAG31_NODE_30939_length_374_cov_0.938182_1_plen_63_part_10